MKALRTIVKSINHQLIIELPDDFPGDEDFEVIVLPMEKNTIVKQDRAAFMKEYQGKIWMSDDFDEPLEDFKEYM